MYEKPKLERFGTFRELTQIGLNSDADGAVIFGIGCKVGKWEIANSCPTSRS
jgi:hypothetical protein